MRKLQFSLLGLLGVVSFVAVACAALAKPNEWWAMIVTNASLAALFVGVLAAIYGHAARRAFWGGFAIVGWGYLVVGWANTTLSNARPDDAQSFVTTRLLEWIGEQTLEKPLATYSGSIVQPPPGVVAGNIYASDDVIFQPATSGAPVQFNISSQQTTPFNTWSLATIGPTVYQQAMSRLMRIGHSLWAIVLGVLGGLLARAFYHRRERLATSAASSG